VWCGRVGVDIRKPLQQMAATLFLPDGTCKHVVAMTRTDREPRMDLGYRLQQIETGPEPDQEDLETQD